MRDADGAIAAWRALPRRARHQAWRLAERGGEPHPDPAVAAVASAYARARLAGLRRVPAVLPVLAIAAALAAPAALATAHPPDWPRYAVLMVPWLVLLPTFAVWCLVYGQWLPGRLRVLAAAIPAEPDQLVIRYLRPRRARIPFVVQAATFAACLMLGHLHSEPVSLAAVFCAGMTVPLAYLGLSRWLRARRAVPGPAACVIGAGGVALLPREPGAREPGATLPWSRLARIAVLDLEPGGSQQAALIVLVDQDRYQAPFPLWPERPVVSPAAWARANFGRLVLNPAELDHSAEEIMAALSARAPVPVEHHVLADPRGPAGRRGIAAPRR